MCSASTGDMRNVRCLSTVDWKFVIDAQSLAGMAVGAGQEWRMIYRDQGETIIGGSTGFYENNLKYVYFFIHECQLDSVRKKL